MATQPTNLPVPSESPRDLKFNAGKIDEFVNSLVNTYVDRFGNEHYTIEGLRWLAQQAIAQYGWILIDSFQDGADITLPNQALRDESTGEYYRWDGSLPKRVDAGSTPNSSGGVGIGAWIGIGDASLRSVLASSDDGKGDALIAVKPPLPGAVARTQHSKNYDFISLLDYGIPDDGDYGKTLQKAIDDLFEQGGGTVFIPRGVYSASGVKLKTGVSINGDSKEGISWIPINNNLVMFDDSDHPDETHGMICSISNISIDCKAFTGVTGVRSINGNRIHIVNTNFFGCAKNIEFDRGGNHVISNVLSATTSEGNKAGRLLLWSSKDDKYGAVFTTVDNYRVEGDSVDGSILLRRAVGIRFNNLIVNDNSFDGICIILENDCQGILFNGGVVVGVGTGMLLRKGSGIDKSPIACITQNLDFDQFEQSAVVVEAGRANQFCGGSITSSDISVTAKAFVLNGEFAINNTLNNVFISGYYGLTGTGILISNATNNTLNNVIIDGCDQGIAFVGNCKGTVINGGDLRNNVNHPIVGDIHQEGISVKNLQGFRGSSVVSTPPIPVSGVEVTNIFGVPVRIFINGGAVSLIAINGVATGFTTGAMVLIEPGEKIAVTYSTTPSWNWVGV